MRLRPLLRRIALGAALLIGVAVVGLVAFPTGRYLLRAAWEESRILLARRPITEVAADSTTPAAVRQRLRLVLDARQFAGSALGLRARESFTTYSQLRRDTLVLVLSGAYRDRLEPYTWWFPIVGRVPYKGYFDFTAARQAREALQRRGFDTYMRPASAFSTLGWFNDPLVSTTLRTSPQRLANTVIHELTHNTLYVPGEAEFNESFASFVGARGAAEFFESRHDTASARLVRAEWEDEKRLALFWEDLTRRIDSAFAAHPADSAARVRARDTVYADARRVVVDSLGPLMPTVPRDWLQRLPLDNAALLARRVYAKHLDWFDRYYDERGRDLRRTLAELQEALKGEGAPYEVLRRALYGRTSAEGSGLARDGEKR